ncbi:MAG: alpha/beta hydrolase [Pseudomonadales bacterium]|nr:alpha/beta hydrolase [Pseudomonadales bacterium]
MDNIHLLTKHISSYVLGKTAKVNIDGQQWKYIEQGKGQAIVFLHGLGANIALWRGMMQSYGDKQYRRIAPDIPGFCMHQYLKNQQHTVQSTSRWLDRLLEEVDVDNAHIVAHSTACCLAIYYASTRPDKVKDLTLISLPAIIRPGKLQENPVVKAFFNDIDIRSLEDWERYYLKLFYRAPLSPKTFKKHNCKIHVENHERFLQTADEFMPSLSAIMTHTQKVSCPVLAVNALYDPYSNEEHRQSLDRHFKNITNVSLDKAGHLSFIERQKAVLKLHHQFLNESENNAVLNQKVAM